MTNKQSVKSVLTFTNLDMYLNIQWKIEENPHLKSHKLGAFFCSNRLVPGIITNVALFRGQADRRSPPLTFQFAKMDAHNRSEFVSRKKSRRLFQPRVPKLTLTILCLFRSTGIIIACSLSRCTRPLPLTIFEFVQKVFYF